MKHTKELRAARARKKISQREPARAIGLTQQMVSAWESGEPVAQEHWVIIKDVLGVDLALIQDNSTARSNTNTITGNQQIAVQDCRTVKASVGTQQAGPHGTIDATLSALEYEVLTLFRKYGNAAMLERCLGQLRKAEEDEQAGNKHPYIVHYGGGPIKSIKRGFEFAKQQARMTRRVRPYNLRHMTASELLAAGIDIKTVSEILGNTPEQCMRAYLHVRTEQKRNAVDKL